MAKKVSSKMKSSVVQKKTTRRVRVKKQVPVAIASRSVARPKLAVQPASRNKKVNFRPGPFYALGATALAFSLSLFFYQFAGHKSLGPSEAKVERDQDLARETLHEPKTAFDAEFQKAHSLSLADKMNFWSSMIEKDPRFSHQLRDFVKNEKLNDTAPIFPEKFDCTTYVETVAALSRSATPKELLSRLLEIRYRDGQPSFEGRNHFVEADWIPNNEKSQVLKDITMTLAASSQVQVEFQEKTLHREKWLSAQLRKNGADRSIASTSNQVMESKIPYLPLEDLSKMMDQIPDGAVVNFVRESSPRHDVLVSHQGLLFRTPSGEMMLRHASTGGRVRTESLNHYVSVLKRHNKKRRRWGWAGVNVVQINSSSSPKILRKEVM